MFHCILTVHVIRHSPSWRNFDRRSAAAPRHTPHTHPGASSAPATRPPGLRALLPLAEVTPASVSYTAGPPSLPLPEHHGIARRRPPQGTLKALSLCPTEQHEEVHTDAKHTLQKISTAHGKHMIIFKGRVGKSIHTSQGGWYEEYFPTQQNLRTHLPQQPAANSFLMTGRSLSLSDSIVLGKITLRGKERKEIHSSLYFCRPLALKEKPQHISPWTNQMFP